MIGAAVWPHRLCLDHPALVSKLCLLDISPTLTMYQRTDMAFARAYFHWFFLIQPAPLPETLIAANAGAVLKTFLGAWGSGGAGEVFTAEAMAEYERCWSGVKAIHASCEDYRASAGIDLDHDRLSDQQGARLSMPCLVLWGEDGIVGRMFDPLADWQEKSASSVTGEALKAGHFLAEQVPELVLERLPAVSRVELVLVIVGMLVDRIDPVHFLDLFRRFDVEIDDHGFIVTAHQDAL